MNEHGWIVGYSWTGEMDPLLNGPAAHAVLWKDDQILDLGTLGGLESNAVYVGDGGQVVGFSTINGPPDPFGFFGETLRAFVWENGVMRDLGTLGGPDSFLGYGCANLGNALAVGASLTNSIPNSTTGFPTTDPFLWEQGTMLDLGTLGGTFGFAQCANNRRQVIGDSNLAGDQTQHAFLWERGVLTDLGTLGGDNSNAVAIADSGLVVGSADLPGSETHHGFLWRRGVMTDLGGLYADPCSNAHGVNIRGQVVGDATNCNGLSLHAFLWESGGPMVDLNTLIPPNSSLHLLVAVNINNRGEIVGVGVPQGVPPEDKETRAHVFVLIPCAAGDSEGCEAAAEDTAAATQANRASVSQAPIRVTERRPTPSERVASFRARLARRYHIPSIGIPKE
jgi:probable HAF family extracellular repeat protein